MKHHVHSHTIVIYIQYKFHEIPSICYLVMAEDEMTSVKGHKSMTNVRKTISNNPKLTLVSINNAYTQFGNIISICSQDIAVPNLK